ncbi:neutral/alkaline non-lysosomal ceramidase N-terminal domain-containing protein [Gimesia aquarii]|uniref:Neutral/alkaline non-lysosomal ceramidase n=1 Tax=Gimesia aquarii TaxID=2527964 RepID=A0A517W4M3_9PLAN|nr:neutral/alkaline non-lysosomal ceramidase N-terminal domain-containing protein [Gimesia aquarii]QDU00206.1 Neutral/alkaline non-lysosomal ceramidase [Gimesia aquarii]
MFSSCFILAAEFQVGVAQVDITPPIGFRKGGGYGEIVSTGIHDPLFAKAIVFRQGTTKVAIVMNDLLSVPRELSIQARKQASERTGIPLQNIIIAATHNHGSPEYWGSLRDLAHNAAMAKLGTDPKETVDYQANLVAAWVSTIEQSVKNLRPTQIELAIGRQQSLAFNRRFHMQDGSVRFNPGAGNPEIVRPAGPVDEELPILLFRESTESRKAFASLSLFAMHTAVAGGTEFSADFPAVIQSRLQKQFGQNFISVFAEGTAGDINHIDIKNKNQLRGRLEVERIGNKLADTIIHAIRTSRSLDKPELAVKSETVFAPFEPIGKARYNEAIHLLRNQKSLRVPFLKLVAAWRDCHRYHHTLHYGDRKPLEVQAIRLDRDSAVVALPHEIFVEIGFAIKASSPFRNTIVISLANDVDYYIPTRRAFEEGSYEVTTCPLNPGCGELLVTSAQRLLKSLKMAETTEPQQR